MATKQLPESRLGSSPRNTRPTSPPARRKNVPLSPLALKMQADLQLAGFGERTPESYLRSVRKFVQWLKRAPDQASENDLGHWSLVIGYTRDLTSDARQCVVSTQSNERAEDTASLDRGRSAPSYANARNERLFTPEIHRPNNAQQEETTLERPFRASSMLQAIA
ncbi:MAG: phage integrase N-terminal SAM-like domain-containing protein [Pirellulales bacterium]